jgi:hypothetical protein
MDIDAEPQVSMQRNIIYEARRSPSEDETKQATELRIIKIRLMTALETSNRLFFSCGDGMALTVRGSC